MVLGTPNSCARLDETRIVTCREAATERPTR